MTFGSPSSAPMSNGSRASASDELSTSIKCNISRNTADSVERCGVMHHLETNKQRRGLNWFSYRCLLSLLLIFFFCLFHNNLFLFFNPPSKGCHITTIRNVKFKIFKGFWEGGVVYLFVSRALKHTGSFIIVCASMSSSCLMSLTQEA